MQGHVSYGFEPVRETFAENFTRRGELGGACCAYYRGEKVVDLWAGIRNKATGDPWQRDTMVIIYSATKGLAAMAMALAQSRGLIDYEERVSTYWPLTTPSTTSVRKRSPNVPAENFWLPAGTWAGEPTTSAWC